MTDLHDLYGQETIDELQPQLRRLEETALYGKKFQEAGLEAADVTTWEDFRDIPFTTVGDYLDDVRANPPEGSLFEPGSMISFTPAKGGELPVYETPDDLTAYADLHEELFRRMGVEAGMRAMITFGYHQFGTGYLLHRAFEHNGIEVIPAGPGDAEGKAETIDEFDVDVMWGNPSFALEIAEHGGDALDVFIGAGEPFTSIPGRRQMVHDAYGDLDAAVDYFGLRQAWPVSVETAEEDGLHVVDDYMIVEIIDPETEEVLPLGERGEVVLTHISKQAGPALRYRTGDLSLLEEGSSSYVDGSLITMPNGVFGRTDEMYKIKGIKVYTEGIPLALAGFPDLTGNCTLTITSSGTTDRLEIACEGGADKERLEEELTRQLGISPDSLTLVDDLADGIKVNDERY